MNDKNTIKLTHREALKQALRAALTKDGRVFVIGEDVGRHGGTLAVSKGLLKEFSPTVPLSEAGFAGAGIGALGGMHPIVEVMTVNFRDERLVKQWATAQKGCSW